MAGDGKDFGRRGVAPSPVITHAPQGLPGAPDPISARRLRSLTVSLTAISVGGALLIFATGEAIRHASRCDSAQDEGRQDQSPCVSSSGSGGHGVYSGGGRGFGGSSGASASSGASFGGFGGAGGAHGGFGGGE